MVGVVLGLVVVAHRVVPGERHAALGVDGPQERLLPVRAVVVGGQQLAVDGHVNNLAVGLGRKQHARRLGLFHLDRQFFLCAGLEFAKDKGQLAVVQRGRTGVLALLVHHGNLALGRRAGVVQRDGRIDRIGLAALDGEGFAVQLGHGGERGQRRGKGKGKPVFHD